MDRTKKIMKSRKSFLSMLVFLICVITFAGCGSSTIIDSLKRYNIDTKLLKNYKIAYEFKEETFTGRASSYGVLVFECEPTAFLQSFITSKSDGFSSEKNDKLENEIVAHSSDLKIPNEYFPEWNEEYNWYVFGGIEQEYFADTLFLVYFPTAQQLIVLETGH